MLLCKMRAKDKSIYLHYSSFRKAFYQSQINNFLFKICGDSSSLATAQLQRYELSEELQLLVLSIKCTIDECIKN